MTAANLGDVVYLVPAVTTRTTVTTESFGNVVVTDTLTQTQVSGFNAEVGPMPPNVNASWFGQPGQ